MPSGLAEQKPICFVVAPIGADESPERKKSDKVLKYIVDRALHDEYDIKRADDIRRPGIITAQIIEQLLQAPLVVADLSDGNPNVYYELAIRHATKRPVVHLIAKGQEAPFDVSPMRYVKYDILDIESIEHVQRELRDHVNAAMSGPAVLTPIGFAEILLGQTVRPRGHENDLLQAFAFAMQNISEELKATKQVVERIDRETRSWRLARAMEYGGMVDALAGTPNRLAQLRGLLYPETSSEPPASDNAGEPQPKPLAKPK